jgi:hypothetical protein
MTPDRDRLFELLTDRALVGLGQHEQIELAELLVKAQDVDIAAFDRAAAAVALGALGKIEPMPAGLAQRIEKAALGDPNRPASDFMTTRQLDKLAPGFVHTQVDEILEPDSIAPPSSQIEPEEESLDYKKTLAIEPAAARPIEQPKARPVLLTQEPESIVTLARPNDPYVVKMVPTTQRPFAPTPTPTRTRLVPAPAPAPPGPLAHASSPAQPLASASRHPSSPALSTTRVHPSSPGHPTRVHPSSPGHPIAPVRAYPQQPSAPLVPSSYGRVPSPPPPPLPPPLANVVPFAAVRGPSRAFAIAGWVAAAVCLLLAIGAFAHRMPPAPVAVLPTDPVPTAIQLVGSSSSTLPPSVPSSALTPGELRDNLLAAAGSARAEWTPTKDPLGKTATGEVVWNNDQQKGAMRFRGLAKNDPSRAQYQLWIFDKARDEKYPVDGGVFDIDSETGDVVVPIHATLLVSAPVLFAVTLERPGGVVVSKRDRIVVTAKLPG